MLAKNVFAKTVTFAANATASSALILDGYFALAGIITDSAFTTSTSVNVSVSIEDRDIMNTAWAPTTFTQVYDDSGTAYAINNVSASKCYALGWQVFVPGKHFKFTSSATQSSATTLTVLIVAL